MKKILNVGHCNFDGPRIKDFIESDLEDTEVTEAKTKKEALEALEEDSWDLVMVNRIFDSDGTRGLDFIAEVKKEHPKQKVLLISNFEDAQGEAQNIGAIGGFGKDDLGAPALLGYLKKQINLHE